MESWLTYFVQIMHCFFVSSWSSPMLLPIHSLLSNIKSVQQKNVSLRNLHWKSPFRLRYLCCYWEYWFVAYIAHLSCVSHTHQMGVCNKGETNTDKNTLIMGNWSRMDKGCPLKWKCHHFDEIFITGCTGSFNFRCSQRWKFHQNDDISVSVF